MYGSLKTRYCCILPTPSPLSMSVYCCWKTHAKVSLAHQSHAGAEWSYLLTMITRIDLEHPLLSLSSLEPCLPSHTCRRPSLSWLRGQDCPTSHQRCVWITEPSLRCLYLHESYSLSFSLEWLFRILCIISIFH